MRVASSLPDAEVEDVGEDCDADAGAGAGHDLDQLAPPLEVRGEHHGRRLAHHRVPHAEQEAVAARGNRELFIIYQIFHLSSQIMLHLFQGNTTKHTTLPQTLYYVPK